MYAEYIVKMILNNINSKFMNEQFIKTESKKNLCKRTKNPNKIGP